MSNIIGKSGMGFILDVTRGRFGTRRPNSYQCYKGRRTHNNYIEGFYISEIITMETVLTYIENPKTWKKKLIKGL